MPDGTVGDIHPLFARAPQDAAFHWRPVVQVRPSHLADPALFVFALLAASFVEPEEDRENSLQLLAER